MLNIITEGVDPVLLSEGDIFKDDGKIYKIVNAVRKKQDYIEIDCIDTNNKEFTILLDYTDRVTIIPENKVKWIVEFTTINSSDISVIKSVEFKVFSRNEAYKEFEKVKQTHKKLKQVVWDVCYRCMVGK